MSEAQLESPEPDPVRTGVPEVDAALDVLADLHDTDVAQHPAAFEEAHERLRRALDGADA